MADGGGIEEVSGAKVRRSRLLRRLRFGLRRVLMLVPHLLARRFTRTVPGKIAFMTHNSAYACNPKYIYEELKRRDPGRDTVWIVSKRECAKDYPADAKIAFAGTLRCLREVYSAQAWIDNGIAFSYDFERRPDQMHVQTMHGSLGIKSIANGYENRKKSGRAGRRSARRESELTDCVVTNSAFEEGVFRGVYWKNTPMLRLGHARTDPLFGNGGRPAAEIRAGLARRYGLDADARLALFAPTYRTDLSAKDLDFGFAKMADALAAKFGGDWRLLVRLHGSTRSVRVSCDGAKVVDATDWPDMQELMMVADAGITDYSSWIFDYVVTGRPGFIYASGADRYLKATGLCYPLEETPFPVAYDAETLFANVAAFDAADYARRVKAFLGRMECVDDGHSAERVADWLEKTLAGKEAHG